LIHAYQEYAALFVRRVVKPNNDQGGASLLWLLSDMTKWYDIAASGFVGIPPIAELERDVAGLREKSKPVTDFADETYAHVARNPKAPIWDAFDGLDAALEYTIALGIKYLAALDNPVSQEIRPSESDVRELFGVAWIESGDAIPRKLISDPLV
jgi:hypothetical protein